jgi:hypothetical protein
LRIRYDYQNVCHAGLSGILPGRKIPDKRE